VTHDGSDREAERAYAKAYYAKNKEKVTLRIHSRRIVHGMGIKTMLRGYMPPNLDDIAGRIKDVLAVEE